MTSLTQLIVLLFNFLYGIIIYFITIINYFFIKNETTIVRIMISILFIIDFTFIYLLSVYKINNGIIHIYYLFTFLIGLFIGYIIKKHVKLTKFFLKIIDTYRQR
jgi:hypothetical protein